MRIALLGDIAAFGKYCLRNDKNLLNYFDDIKNENSKISAFLTIQEGCDKFCHFCVVPYTRGPEYSRPFEQIIKLYKLILYL